MAIRKVRGIACVLNLLINLITALPPITIKGAKFFTSNGDQFYIKGVAYGTDNQNFNNLSNGPQCKADADLMKRLGANVIRVYAVDPTLNHDECMKAFEDAGIYVLVDMSVPLNNLNIDREAPTWTKELRNEYAKVVDAFEKYNNALGLFAGSEVAISTGTGPNTPANYTIAATYVKAAIADMKAYRDLMQYRKIPIGYSAGDNEVIRLAQQSYFACGPSAESADFFAIQRFSWCGDGASFQSSLYSKIYSDAAAYSIPIFISATGCVIGTGGDTGRVFSDQPVVLGRQMNDRYSGNIVYEWAQHSNNYGLVEYQNLDGSSGEVKFRADFTKLQNQWATLKPVGAKETAYNPTLTAPACPDYTEGVWNVQKDAKIPTVGLDGFSAPTGTQSTVTGGAQKTGDAVAPGSGVNTSTSSSKKKTKGTFWPVIGGVLGGLVVLTLVVVAFIMHRRRQKRQLKAEGEDAHSAGDSDRKLDGEKDQGFATYYSELSNGDVAQLHAEEVVRELDPAKGEVVPLRANELPPRVQTGEMIANTEDKMERGERTCGIASGRGELQIAQEDTATSQSGTSPYVQAQRRLEMEWLESEEARLRQKRELLLGQQHQQQQQ